jgi:RNA polymerase sigma-70 factor (ECF subfamily)
MPVDDLVQDTFVAMTHAITRFRGEASVRTYLFEVARRVLYAAHRTAYVRLRADTTEGEEVPCDACSGTDDVREALSMLEVDLFTVVALFYWDGLNTREIAERLAIPEGTVSSRLRRARDTLRHHLVQS